ncbi:MAG: class I SAM-dependent methyltransferase [Candidatus Eremiobacteraeota bacterium]|nr:class I SAM-dependent methyltransferase [Candidatus Eremiobacteraeota bacterium]
MRDMTPEEKSQRAHFEELGGMYYEHYSDRWSLEYRDRFIHEPLISGLDVEGLNVLEAMCGAGEVSRFLVQRGAVVTGVDISPTQMHHYSQTCPEARPICAPILDTGLEAESFDLIVTVGGLHHLHPKLDEAVEEIHRLLKPGGYFCFSEPHTGSFIDVLRRAWYRIDPLFEAEEEAVDIEALRAAHHERFEFCSEIYLGNIAYFVVLNSMILRIPHWLKKLLSPAALPMEGFFNRFLTPRFSCYALSQWRKK